MGTWSDEDQAGQAGLMDPTELDEARDVAAMTEEEEYAALQSRERAEELRGEAGEPVGPMPPDDLPPDPVEHAEPPETPRVDGTTQLQMIDGGGPAGKLSFRGAKCEVTPGTDFPLGETVEFRFAATVRERGEVQKVDAKTGHVTTHMAYVLEVEDVMRPEDDG